MANRFNAGIFEYTVHNDRFHAPYDTKIPKNRTNEEGINNVFVCSAADLFGEWVETTVIQDIIKVCRDTPQWTYIFLTKNPKRLLGFTFPVNSWAGTTVDCNARVTNALKYMPQVKAPVRFISCEPLLEDLQIDSLRGFEWLIIGAQSETKTNGMPEFQPEKQWVTKLIATARAAGTKVFIKPNLRVDLAERPKEFFNAQPLVSPGRQAEQTSMFL
jgi:protein gp37